MGATRKRSLPNTPRNDNSNQQKPTSELTLNNIPLGKLAKYSANTIKQTQDNLTGVSSSNSVFSNKFGALSNENVIGTLPKEGQPQGVVTLNDYVDRKSQPQFPNTEQKNNFELARDFLHLNVNFMKFIEDHCQRHQVYDLTPSLEDYIQQAKQIRARYNSAATQETTVAKMADEKKQTKVGFNVGSVTSNINVIPSINIDNGLISEPPLSTKSSTSFQPFQALSHNKSDIDNKINTPLTSELSSTISKPLISCDNDSIIYNNPLLNKNADTTMNTLLPNLSTKKSELASFDGANSPFKINSLLTNSGITSGGLTTSNIGSNVFSGVNKFTSDFSSTNKFASDLSSSNKFTSPTSIKNDDIKIDGIKGDVIKSDVFKSDGIKSDGIKSDVFKSDGIKSGGIKGLSGLLESKPSDIKTDIVSGFSLTQPKPDSSNLSNLSTSAFNYKPLETTNLKNDKESYTNMFSPFGVPASSGSVGGAGISGLGSNPLVTSPSLLSTTTTTTTPISIPLNTNSISTTTTTGLTADTTSVFGSAPKPFGSNSTFSLGLTNPLTTFNSGGSSGLGLGIGGLTSNVTIGGGSLGSIPGIGELNKPSENADSEPTEATEQDQEAQAKQQLSMAIEPDAFHHQMCRLYYKGKDGWKLIGCGVINLLESSSNVDGQPKQLRLIVHQSPSTDAKVLLNIKLNKALDSTNVLEPSGICFMSVPNPVIVADNKDTPLLYLLKFKNKTIRVEFQDKFNDKITL